MTAAKNRSDSSTSPAKTVAALILILIACMAASWLAKAWMSETKQADAVEQAVSQFAVPETWTETVNTGEPGRVLCLGGNACPSARITWQAPGPLSVTDMTRLVTDADAPAPRVIPSANPKSIFAKHSDMQSLNTSADRSLSRLEGEALAAREAEYEARRKEIQEWLRANPEG